ncbi:MAG: DUF4956 domain-containing protein [Planctomycetota bacterium]
MLAQFAEYLPKDLDLATLGWHLLFVLILSHLLGWHFVRFAQVVSNKRKLSRVFVIISVTTLLIISVVKVSLALSLGLVGALSIIRFRTPIKEPEELGYLFVAIAIGVGFGAERGIETGVVVLVLLLVIALRTGLPGGKPSLRTVLQVTASEARERSPIDALWPIVQQHTERAELRRVDFDGTEFYASAVVELSTVERLQTLIDSVRSALPGSSVSVVERDSLE